MAEPGKGEILGLRTLHEGFTRFVIAKVRLPDGTVLDREIEDHGEAVAVLAYDPERRTAFLIRLFRPPPLLVDAEAELVEAPAGLIGDEDAETAARREMEEEVGLRLGALERVATVWASPGLSTERITLFLAACSAADRVGPGGGKAGEHEGITVLETPLAELWSSVERGEITDMKLLALAQALRLRRPDLFEKRA